MDALRRGGADAIFSCRKGSCWTCLLQAESGTPDPASQARLPQALVERNMFLPCIAREMDQVVARPADLSQLFIQAMAVEKKRLSPETWMIRLELPLEFGWTPGQYVNLRNPAGDVRSYSIASVKDEDFFLDLHVRHYPDGRLSEWIARDLQPGDEVLLRGPLGTCTYRPGDPDQPLLLIGTGTGVAPLLGVARDALAQGHRGPIRLYHGAATESGLYLKPELAAIAAACANFHTLSAASREGACRRIVDIALDDHADLAGFAVYLAGNPDAVEAARVRALAQGAALDAVHADPFEPEIPYQPQDKAKLAAIQADPEIWAALGQGTRMRAMLEDFYARVYADPLLEPFFHRVTRERAIDKQYEFLADLFTGTRTYFGHSPFNAHHWMVISDELFDYRERLFFEVVRAHGLAEPLIARWASLHERFRREIVKSAPRGLIHNGAEHMMEGFSVETIEVETVCDGCHEEVAIGTVARMHRRTGELFCARCEAKAAN